MLGSKETRTIGVLDIPQAIEERDVHVFADENERSLRSYADNGDLGALEEDDVVWLMEQREQPLAFSRNPTYRARHARAIVFAVLGRLEELELKGTEELWLQEGMALKEALDKDVIIQHLDRLLGNWDRHEESIKGQGFEDGEENDARREEQVEELRAIYKLPRRVACAGLYLLFNSLSRGHVERLFSHLPAEDAVRRAALIEHPSMGAEGWKLVENAETIPLHLARWVARKEEMVSNQAVRTRLTEVRDAEVYAHLAEKASEFDLRMLYHNLIRSDPEEAAAFLDSLPDDKISRLKDSDLEPLLKHRNKTVRSAGEEARERQVETQKSETEEVGDFQEDEREPTRGEIGRH